MTEIPGDPGATDRCRSGRFGIALLLSALAVEVTLASFPVSSITQQLTTSLVAMALAMLVPWFFPTALVGYARANRPVLILAGAFLASCAASAAVSPFPKVLAIKGLARYVFIFGTSFSLVFLFWLRPPLSRIFLRTVVALAMALAAVSVVEAHHAGIATGLADVFRHGEHEMIGNRFRAAATMFHPNTLGCLLSLAILIAVCLKAGGDMGAPLFSLSVGLLGTGIAMAGSRNSLLMVAIPLAGLLFNRAVARTALAALLLSAASIAVWPGSIARFTDTVSQGTVQEVAGTVESGPEAHVSYHFIGTRLLLWESATRIWRDHPVLGIGPGVCKDAMKSYASPALREVEGHKLERGFLNAHNGLLNLLAEEGIVGTVLAAALFLFLCRRIVTLYGILPLQPVHAVLAGLVLSFVPDDFTYSFLYMVLFVSTALMCSLERCAPFRSHRPE